MTPYNSKNVFCHTHILPAQKWNLGVVNGSKVAIKSLSKRPHEAGEHEQASHDRDIERERESEGQWEGWG